MRHKKGSYLILIGLLLIAAAFFLIGYNLYDSNRAERTSREVIEQLNAYIPTKTKYEYDDIDPITETVPAASLELPDYVRNPEKEMPVQTIDGQDYIGVLRIPAIDLELPVISRWSDAKMRIAPCRYSGSVYQNNLVIVAHNYASHFGSLKNLREGDAVIFVDMDGNVFSYAVTTLETLNPTEVEEMISGDWDLSLFTCTIGGRARVTVRCALEKDGMG